ncbi:MAG: hypothetical protein HZA60_07930 [Deltaproteobacteria bacterium]|nr:hypothetical protein [Deltaproteobacteria bacterium]
MEEALPMVRMEMGEHDGRKAAGWEAFGKIGQTRIPAHNRGGDGNR